VTQYHVGSGEGKKNPNQSPKQMGAITFSLFCLTSGFQNRFVCNNNKFKGTAPLAFKCH